MESRLLNPKVHYAKIMYLTQEAMVRRLKQFKQKKYGMKDFAVEVEEVEVKESFRFGVRDKRYGGYAEERTIKPGNYFNLYVEYIV